MSRHVVCHDYRGIPSLEHLYLSKKTVCFSYKGGYIVRKHMRIKAFKTRAGLGYR